jgi:very-short-patch-repair endonuclease
MITLKYIVFFGLLAVGLVCFVFFKAPKPIESPRDKCESPIERKLYDALTFNGYDVHTQVKCGPYRIDLALFIGSKKLAIECDGKAYHSSPRQKAHDRKKNAYLRKNGWEVLRFSGRQIYRDTPKIIKKIALLNNGVDF